MAKPISSPQRNVEHIRRKNLEDNQIFLSKLLMTDIRNDFLDSARSIIRKDGSSQIKKKRSLQQQKVERATRYSEKVKTGIIGPFVPEWQRHKEEKAKKRLFGKEQRKKQYEIKKQQRKLEIEQKKQQRKLEIKQKKQQRKLEKFEPKKQEILFAKQLKKTEKELILQGHLEENLSKSQLPPKWLLLYKNNNIDGNPYQRAFKPRHSKASERIEQSFIPSK